MKDGLRTGDAAEGATDTAITVVNLDVYWERLRNLIPGEVSAIYVAGSSVIPPGEKIGLLTWAIFCLVAVILFMARQTRLKDPVNKKGSDWIHMTISTISFVIWIYALGGPFSLYGLSVGWVATLLMLGWTFLVPFFYGGQPE